MKSVISRTEAVSPIFSGPPAFVEAPAWNKVGAGWRLLFGSFQQLGFSFEWHEFTAPGHLDWARSFHPNSVEICLNLEGRGMISAGQQSMEVIPESCIFYYQGRPALSARREAGQKHRFLTVELSPLFLREYLLPHAEHLHPLVHAAVRDEAAPSSVAPAQRLAVVLRDVVDSLRRCPVFNPARELWFRGKALEIAAHLFFQPPGGELLCTRTQRLARERVETAKLILRERMQSPPTLEELARLVSCSPSYLSRQFAQAGGVTMQQYLRQVRMERAAELLRTGRCNVTEAALEVGYNSLSHFSSTFHETYGCCPGLYPLKTAPQQSAIKRTSLGP